MHNVCAATRSRGEDAVPRTIGQVGLVAQPGALDDLALEVHALLREGLAVLGQLQELGVWHLEPVRTYPLSLMPTAKQHFLSNAIVCEMFTTALENMHDIGQGAHLSSGLKQWYSRRYTGLERVKTYVSATVVNSRQHVMNVTCGPLPSLKTSSIMHMHAG